MHYSIPHPSLFGSVDASGAVQQRLSPIRSATENGILDTLGKLEDFIGGIAVDETLFF